MKVAVAVRLLFLLLVSAAAGCTQAAVPEEAAVGGRPAANAEQAQAEAPVVDKSESSSASRTPEIEMPPPTSTITPTSQPEQPELTATSPAITPPAPSTAEAGQIYAAAISQVYFVENSFGGDPPEFPLVYIISTTTDGTLLQAPPSIPQEIKPELQKAIAAALDDPPFDIIWVASRDDVPVDNSGGQIAGGDGIYIILGNILPQQDGTVQLPLHMVCGTLCLSGKTYVLENIAGAWQVTGNVGLVIEA